MMKGCSKTSKPLSHCREFRINFSLRVLSHMVRLPHLVWMLPPSLCPHRIVLTLYYNDDTGEGLHLFAGTCGLSYHSMALFNGSNTAMNIFTYWWPNCWLYLSMATQQCYIHVYQITQWSLSFHTNSCYRISHWHLRFASKHLDYVCNPGSLRRKIRCCVMELTLWGA